MAAFDQSFAAGGMANTLEQIIKEKFLQQLENRRAQEAQQHIGLEGQRVGQESQRIGQESQRIGQEGQRIGFEGQRTALAQKAYDEAATSRAADLARTQAETTDILGRPAQAELARGFTGGQNAAQRATQLKLGEMTGQRTIEAAKIAAASRENSPSGLVMVNTVDAQGNPTTKIVPKTAGAEYQKPLNATTDTRVRSAETVNQVGNDMIQKLSDPKFKAVLGPAMGRYATLQDFVGNPPPEFSQLAGEIESYALANMGVHGMRSAQGAQMIQKLMTAKHTPESLAATIQGLNKFSESFVQNNKPGSTAIKTAPPPPAKPTAEELIKKYGGG